MPRKKKAKKKVAVKRRKAPVAELATASPNLSSDDAGLSLTGVFAVIDFARERGVKALRFRNLSVEFESTLDESKKAPSHPQTSGLTSDNKAPKSAPMSDKSRAIRDEQEAVEVELEHLKVTDPAAWEAHVLSEDAADGDDDGDDSQ